MRKLCGMTCFALLLALAGCIPSVHPLYTEQDLIFDPALVGEWADKEGKDLWTFTRNGEKGYHLEYVDANGKKGEFKVHLLQAEGRRFLDFYPADPELKQNDFYKIHLLPVHTFMRVQPIAPILQMSMLKLDWVKKFLTDKPDAVRHENVNDTILLTAPPKELQAFLIATEKTPEAWDGVSALTRKEPKPPAPPQPAPAPKQP